MTVSNNEIISAAYTGDGVETTFGLTFKWWSKSDILVTVDGAVVNESLYAVSTGVGAALGSSNIESWVVFNDAPLNTLAITFTQALELTQDTDYPPFTKFKGESHEAALDKIVLIARANNLDIAAMQGDAVGIVSANIASVNTTSSNIANVNTVAGVSADVTTVAGIAPEVTAVSANAANVNTVAGVSADVTAVAGNNANITATAGNATNINAAVSNASNINSAVSNATNINSAVTNEANINTVAGIAANVTSTAGNETNINSVVANATNINTVAGISANINSVAGNTTNINAAVTNAADITATADNGVDISFVADNLTEISAAASALAALDTATTADGWTASSDTWVYVDANTFKIVGVDRSSQFPVGAKIQLTNPAAKYRYVASVAFSTDTTVSLLNNAGTALANSAITLPKYSYQDTPAGFPNWGSGDQNSALAVEVAANVSGVATNAAGVATNVTNIATNTTNIATGVTNASTNTTNIATNTTNIGVLQARPELKSGIIGIGHGTTLTSTSEVDLTAGHDISLTRTDTGIIITPTISCYADAGSTTSMGYWLRITVDQGSGYGVSYWTTHYRLLSYVATSHLDRLTYVGQQVHLANSRAYSSGLFKVKMVGKILYAGNNLVTYNGYYHWEETL